MRGNKSFKSTDIVRMNNSKKNVIGKSKKVLVCSNKWVSMYNSIRKVTIRKKLRSGNRRKISCSRALVQDAAGRSKQRHGGILIHRTSRDVLVCRQSGNKGLLGRSPPVCCS